MVTFVILEGMKGWNAHGRRGWMRGAVMGTRDGGKGEEETNGGERPGKENFMHNPV